MTGAPKIRAMQLIEEHESFKRGLYSGSIGYIDPSGDFDLNVIIRTIIYNQNLKTLSCAVGSAITISSEPEKEYEECGIKIQKLLDGIAGQN
jgi:para-aminobenzoate synthetase component 1